MSKRIDEYYKQYKEGNTGEHLFDLLDEVITDAMKDEIKNVVVEIEVDEAGDLFIDVNKNLKEGE